ncbi:MAG: hypothetical protein ACREJC_10060 [Tepidisphaeraceae bacterium]
MAASYTPEQFQSKTPDPFEFAPFITETATKVFRNNDEAIGYFKSKGYIK